MELEELRDLRDLLADPGFKVFWKLWDKQVGSSRNRLESASTMDQVMKAQGELAFSRDFRKGIIEEIDNRGKNIERYLEEEKDV